ncbi:MAG: hypothetical protein P8Y91_09860 [Desulfuromonadales bacterium]
MHAAIANLSVSFPDGHWPGSISVGVAVKTAAMDHPEDLIKAADLGVYAAKDAGRNCVRMIDGRDWSKLPKAGRLICLRAAQRQRRPERPARMH